MGSEQLSTTELQKQIYHTMYGILRTLHAEKKKHHAEEITRVIEDLEVLNELYSLHKTAICEYIPHHAYNSTWRTGKNFTDNPFIKQP